MVAVGAPGEGNGRARGQRVIVQHLQGAPDLPVIEARIEAMAGVQAGGQVSEAGTETGEIFTFAVAIAAHDPAYPLGANVATEVLVRLLHGRLAVGDEDETPGAAVFGVEFQHRLGRGSGTGEEIENQIVRLGGDAQNAFDQADRFGGGEGGLCFENVLNLLARLIGMPDLFVRPPGPGDDAFNVF